MKQALFVCTGNTCRSNVAELIAVNAAAELGLSGWKFASAGIFAYPGSPASENSCAAMREMGLDLSAHRATCLNQNIVDQSELILTMTPAHKAQLIQTFPHASHKIFGLLEFAYGKPEQIEDPFGGDLAVYRRTSAQIKQAVYKALEQLNTLV